MKIISGIYKITSPKGRIYIGQSKNILLRKTQYASVAVKNQPKVYNSIKKYGWAKHKFEVLHECTVDQLNDLEKYYVDLHSSFTSRHGLNAKDGGGNRVKFSEEVKEKIRQKAIGRIVSEETKNKMRASRMNMSAETRLKMSLAGKGRPKSEEHRRKIGEAHKGKSVSDAHKISISKTLTGRKIGPFTEEHKRKISESLRGKNLGFKHSAETIKKMSESNSGSRNGMYGKKQSQETKDKIAIRLRAAALRIREERMLMIF